MPKVIRLSFAGQDHWRRTNLGEYMVCLATQTQGRCVNRREVR